MRSRHSSLPVRIGRLLLGGLVVVSAGQLWAQTQPVAPAPPPAPRPAAPAAQAAPAPAAAPAAQPAPPAPGVAQTGAAPPAQAGRDPFDPLVTKPEPPSAEGGPAGAERRQALSGLRLVGVLWDAKSREQIRALVETPDGLGYYVRVNEEKFGGKVLAIERDRVRFSVREQVPGSAPRERTVELKLGGQ